MLHPFATWARRVHRQAAITRASPDGVDRSNAGSGRACFGATWVYRLFMASPTTVLVADDESDLRLLVGVALRAAGYTVVDEASDGDEALAVMARLGPPLVPAVMILDNKMPGLSGLEVAERVLAKLPAQPIILFSAYLDTELVRRATEIGIRGCLAKTDIARLPALIAAMVAD